MLSFITYYITNNLFNDFSQTPVPVQGQSVVYLHFTNQVPVNITIVLTDSFQ